MYLDDLLTAMSKIEKYIEHLNYESFQNDSKTIDAVIRNFEVIGEASKNLPENIKKKYIEVPWAEMYALRNKVSHEYFGVDLEILWDVAINYLPDNKLQIERIIQLEFNNEGL